MSPEEVRVMSPLVRAIFDLYRTKPPAVFEHLIRHTGFPIDNHDVRANPSLAMALDAFAELHGASCTAAAVTGNDTSADRPRASLAVRAPFRSKGAGGR